MLVDAIFRKAAVPAEQPDVPVTAPTATLALPSQEVVLAPHAVRFVGRRGEHAGELLAQRGSHALVRVERQHPFVSGARDRGIALGPDARASHIDPPRTAAAGPPRPP